MAYRGQVCECDTLSIINGTMTVCIKETCEFIKEDYNAEFELILICCIVGLILCCCYCGCSFAFPECCGYPFQCCCEAFDSITSCFERKIQCKVQDSNV